VIGVAGAVGQAQYVAPGVGLTAGAVGERVAAGVSADGVAVTIKGESVGEIRARPAGCS